MKIIIIGARFDGHANVVLEILNSMKKFEIIGFVDDSSLKIGQMHKGISVIGNTDQLIELKIKHNIYGGFVAIGNNYIRTNLSNKLKNAGYELINAIHPSVIIDTDVEVGHGNYIGPGVILVTGSKIGNFVNIHTGTSIDHDNILEDGVNIGPGVHTAGRVHIQKNATIGTGASLIPDVVIGENSIVGAGSVVIKNIPNDVTVIGVPSKILKYNF